jgi:hypothetical protein
MPRIWVATLLFCGPLCLTVAGVCLASAWYIETVDSEGDVGDHTSVTLDANGHPHIAYRDKTNADAKYAAWNGTSWEIRRLQAGTSCAGDGTYPSVALDGSGQAHIATKHG